MMFGIGSLGTPTGVIRIDTTALERAQAVVVSASRQMTTSMQDFGRRAEASLRSLDGAFAAISVAGLAAANRMNQAEARLRVASRSGEQFARNMAKIEQLANETGEPFAKLLENAGRLAPQAARYGIELEKLITLSRQLVALDPVQGIEGAVISIQELLSGDMTSLWRRFELPRKELNQIRDRAEGDANALLDGISRLVDEFGVSQEALRQLRDEGVFAFSDLQYEITHTLDMGFRPLLRDGIVPTIRAVRGLLDGVREFKIGNTELGEFLLAIGGGAIATRAASGAIGRFISPALGGLVSRAGGVGLSVAGGVFAGTEIAGALKIGGAQSGEDARENLAKILAGGISGVVEAFEVGGVIVGNAISNVAAAIDTGTGILQVIWGNLQVAMGRIIYQAGIWLQNIGVDSRDIIDTGMSLGGTGFLNIHAGEEKANRGFSALVPDEAELNDIRDRTKARLVQLFNDIFAPLLGAEPIVVSGAESGGASSGSRNNFDPNALLGSEAVQDLLSLIDEQVRERQQRRIDEARDAEDYARGRLRDIQDFQSGERRAFEQQQARERDAIAQMAAISSDAQKRELQTLQQAQVTRERAFEDHQMRLSDIATQFGTQIEEAAADRNGAGLIRAARAATEATRRENQQYSVAERRRQEDLNATIQSLREQRDERLRDAAQRLQEMRTDFATQQQQREADFNQRLQREDEDRRVRLQRLEEDYRRQDEVRQREYNAQLTELQARVEEETGFYSTLRTNVTTALTGIGTAFANMVNAMSSAVTTPITPVPRPPIPGQVPGFGFQSAALAESMSAAAAGGFMPAGGGAAGSTSSSSQWDVHFHLDAAGVVTDVQGFLGELYTYTKERLVPELIEAEKRAQQRARAAF